MRADISATAVSMTGKSVLAGTTASVTAGAGKAAAVLAGGGVDRSPSLVPALVNQMKGSNSF